MRIIIVTPGTGSFFCGTCMRDNTLARGLRNLGHDALLLPLYLPLALDEESAAEGAPLFYGGVNVYLQQKSALFRKSPRWLDSVLDSPAALRPAAKRAGMTEPSDLGDLTLSMLRGEEGKQKKELDRLARWLSSDGRADVICLSNALLMGMARQVKKLTGAAVFCTLQGEDYFIDLLKEPWKSLCWKELAGRADDVDGYIAVSRYYADVMTRRANLTASRVHVVENGILMDGYRTEPPESPPVIGYLARMCALKGLRTLIDSFILIHERGRFAPRLRIAGTMTAGDIAYVDECKRAIASARLQSHVDWLPNVDREAKQAALRGLSVFSVPATYGESFGLYVLEALASGVPVVQPDHAAFPELIESTGGGLLCKPDDPESLADQIENLLADPERARKLGETGRKAVLENYSSDVMSANALRVFQSSTLPN